MENDHKVNDGVAMTFGKIVDFNVHVDELKLYKGIVE